MKPRSDRELRGQGVKLDSIDRMLTEQGDVTTGEWRETVGKALPPVENRSPDFHTGKYMHAVIRFSPKLAAASSQCAAKEGLSREQWIREMMADRIEKVLGIPRAELLDPRYVPRARAIKERLERGD